MKEKPEFTIKTTLTDINERAGQIFKGVYYSQNPVTVTDHGRPICAIVPIQERVTRQRREKC